MCTISKDILRGAGVAVKSTLAEQADKPALRRGAMI